MDGNSLGPASDAALASVDRVVDEWRDLLIGGWTDADPPWFSVGERLGDALAPRRRRPRGGRRRQLDHGEPPHPDRHLPRRAAGRQRPEARGVAAGGREVGAGREPGADPAVLVNELDFPSDHYAIRARPPARDRPDESSASSRAATGGRSTRAISRPRSTRTTTSGSSSCRPRCTAPGSCSTSSGSPKPPTRRARTPAFDAAHPRGRSRTSSARPASTSRWCTYGTLNTRSGFRRRAVRRRAAPRAHRPLWPGGGATRRRRSSR